MRIAIASFLLAVNVLGANAASGVSEGDPAPDFSLPVLGDEASATLSETRGRVRYLDFWASWCAPCRVSIPEMIALKQELSDRRFEIVAISVDKNVEDAVRFLARYPVNYVNLSDAQGMTAKAYALRAMPMSFVIDHEGRVTMAHAGFRPGDMPAIRAHILELLDRLPPGGS